MKSQRLTSLLVGILFFSSVCAAGLASWYVISLMSLQSTQRKRTEINTVTTQVKMLVNEVMEYRKRNPAIDPILQSVNLLPQAGPPAPVVPTPKPPIK